MLNETVVHNNFQTLTLYNLNINSMIGRNAESNSWQEDIQINHLQHEIQRLINIAKNLVDSCKLPTDNQQVLFEVSPTEGLIFPQYKNELNYSAQFWKMYVKNESSFCLVKQLSQKTSNLTNMVHEIQQKQQQFFKAYKHKNRKKNRRLDIQIEKNFACPYQKCYKVYGSDVSLNLHIKIKHNGGNKTDREKLAEAICLAEINVKPLPKITLQIPPGYLQEYRQNKFKKVLQHLGPEQKNTIL